VDTIGVGDAFAATAVLGFLAGFFPEKISEIANGYVAFLCTQSGATPQFPKKFYSRFVS